ncbi:YSC84-related protein [Cupriavidus basilensis]|uniref:YSC84-related protein n=1 Tax=Cupriavidus basilensis TaxID=68895 RepID=A0ABT6AWC2_9BURK|nr:YSC84-related protein [Cupriavidus basilensis]MDF3836931.1 YSC84-related protein [Cupriavidus basilensis]
MERRSFLTVGAGLVLASSGLLGACTTTPEAPTDKSAKRREIDGGVDGALNKLYDTAKGSRELANRARGILVFPNTISAGFVVGGEYGDGALRAGSANRGYYRIISGSVGWQIGAQSKAIILMFMTQDALDKFVASQGWTAGVDATVAVAKVGANGTLDTNTAQQPVVGFVVTNAGLMAGLSLEGSKISKLDL